MTLAQRILYKLVSICSKEWQNSKVKVLIFEKDNYRIRVLQDVIKNYAPKLNEYHIKIVTKKITFLRYTKHANIIYAYGISRYIIFNQLNTIYLGQVGYYTKKNLPKAIRIISTPNFAAEFIVEYIIASIFSFEWKFHIASYQKIKKDWQQLPFLVNKARPIKEYNIGILGMGRVGKSLAARLLDFGFNVKAFDPFTFDTSHKDITYKNKEGLKAILESSDYLIVTMSYNDHNYHFISEKELSLMKENLCLINISRGKIVDQKALIQYLKLKKIRGAVLDVFEEEPLPKSNPLWSLENVIITPHISGNINYCFEKIANHFINTILQEKNIDG